MGATTRREPVRNTIPKAKAYQYYNVLDFKGIEITDNPFNASTGSCSDCLNVYVDKEGSLTTRPRLEIMSELKNIVALQNATFIAIYGLVEGYLIHCIINNVNKFYRYANNTLTAITDTDNLCPATRCKTFEQNDVIYILTGNNYLNIINNDLSEVEGYIPTIRTGITTDKEGLKAEDYNILSNDYYLSYAWDLKSSITNIPTTGDLLIAKEDFNALKTYTFINEDVDDANRILPDVFFNDNNYIGHYSVDGRKTYYYVRYIDSFTREMYPIVYADITVPEFFSGSFACGNAETGDFLLKDSYEYNDTDYNNLYYGNVNSIINNKIKLTKWESTSNLFSTLKLSQKGQFAIYFKENSDSFFNVKKVDGSVTYSMQVTQTNLNGYITIPVISLDDDNNTIGLCCKVVDSGVVSYYVGNAPLADGSINVSTLKKINVKDFSTLSAENAFYNHENKILLFDNYIANTETGEINRVRLVPDNARLIYADKEGFAVYPYKNTQGIAIQTLVCPNVYENPNGVIIYDFTNIEIATNKTLYSIGLTNDNFEYRASYNKNEKSFNVEGTYGGFVNPFHVNIAVNERAEIRQKFKITNMPELNVKRESFLKSLITTRFFNQRWFTSDSHIFWTNNNDPTYIPLDNYDLLGDDGYDVTGLNVISDTGMVAYTSKQLSIITPVKDRGDGNWDYSFTETKNTTGNIAKGNTIVTSYSTLPLQIDYKGIFTIQQTENVVSEANVVTPITNAIMRKWMKESETSRNMVENTRTMNYLYWTYFLLDTGTNTKIYVLDNRTLSWFYWEIPIRVMDMYVEDEEAVFFDYNGVKYVMKTEDINEHNNNEYNLRTYYDELPEANEIIHWYWNSQILPLGSINFSKQLVATTFILNDDENTDNYGLRYKFRGFRKTIYETDNRDIEGDLQYVRNKTIRSMFTRIQFLQILLSDKADDLIGDYSRLRLVGLGFKYRLLEANRT